MLEPGAAKTSEVMEQVDPIFYSDPVAAARKGLRLVSEMSHPIMEAPTPGTHHRWRRCRKRLLHILERTWRDNLGYLTLPLDLHEDGPPSVEERSVNIDPRGFPAYTIGEAAGYLHMPRATLRSWTVGRRYRTQEGPAEFEPVIRCRFGPCARRFPTRRRPSG